MKKKGTEKSAETAIKINVNKKHDNPIHIPTFLGLAIVLILGIVIYSNSFDCSFHFDDLGSIIENKNIQDGATPQSVWASSHNRFWPYYSLAINYRLGGLEVWGYHFFNLLVHLINTLIVYWLVILIFKTPVLKENKAAEKKNLLAFAVALLFVSHPLATQSVTYIVQRMASMVALFYFLSVALYIKGRITENSTKYLYLIGAGFSALMCFTSKENGYTLPLSIILTEFCLLQTKKISFSYKDYRVWLALFISVLFVGFALSRFTLSIFAPIPPVHGNTYTLTWQNYLYTQFSVIVKYIQLLFLPIHQNLDYDYNISNSLFEIRTLMSLLLLLGLLIIALLQYNKNRLISFCILWFFITLSVESSVVPIADVIFEHRTYLPSLGFFILFSYLIVQLTSKAGKTLPLLILSVIGIINASLTYSRNKVWKDDESLYSDVIEKAPTKARAWGSRADIYRDRGEDEKAMSDYNEAITLSPTYAIALHNRAGIFEKQNKLEKAIEDYSRAIASDSNYLKALYNRGSVYNRIGKYDSSIIDLTKAIKIDPKFTNAYVNRGSAYVNIGDNNKAIEDFNIAIGLDVNSDRTYYNRGNAYFRLKKYEEAISDFSKAIELDHQMKNAYYNRAIIYNELKEYDKAISDYTAAINIDPKFLEAYVNRGYIFSNKKEYTKAIIDYKKALEINPNFALAINNLKYAQSQAGVK
jgi:tetratricopeptide (TPR) repeat protein